MAPEFCLTFTAFLNVLSLDERGHEVAFCGIVDGDERLHGADRFEGHFRGALNVSWDNCTQFAMVLTCKVLGNGSAIE